MLDRPNHPYSSRLPLYTRTPPSPTLISFSTDPVIPTLLDAQDELDFLAIDEGVRKTNETRRRFALGTQLKAQSKLLVDLDESELVQAATEEKRPKSPLVTLRGRPGRAHYRSSKPGARVGPLVDIDFNESLLLSALSYWKPKPKDAPHSQDHKLPPVERISSPPAYHSRRPRQPVSKPARRPAPVTPPRQSTSITSGPFIVSPTPLRALPLQLRANAPIFRPINSPPPRLATPSSLFDTSSSERIGDIYIDPPARVLKLFQANIKFHPFPTIPKVFWGRSEEQIKREREQAARAGSDSEDDDDFGESRSEVSRKRDRLDKRNETLKDRTPTKRQKSGQPGRRLVGEVEDDPYSQPAQARPSHRDRPLDAFAEPCIPRAETAPRRTTDSPAADPYLIPLDGDGYNEHEFDPVMNLVELGDHCNTVSAFGPFEGMMSKSAYRRLLSMPSARTNIPSDLISRTRTRPLDRTILAAWKKTEPTPAAREQVRRLLDTLHTSINTRLSPPRPNEKGPRFEVDVFGSVSWGGETGQSGDLDIVVIDHDMPYGYEPGLWKRKNSPLPSRAPSRGRPRSPVPGLPPVYNLSKLARVLYSAGMTKTFGINATTPIVKFSAPAVPGQRTLECDINVNDLGGWYNSSLILHYCLISPFVLRPLIYSLKRWAAAFELNDASGAKGPATMSSYCLTLMAIAYLQHRGVLPNLQASVASRTPDDPSIKKDLVWVAWSRDQGIPAHIGFDTVPPTGWTSREPDMTVGEAVRGFFSFFAQSGGSAPGGRMDWDTQMISILQGGIVSRSAKHGTMAQAKEAQRQKLEEQGWFPNVAESALAQADAALLAVEDKMGKGDRGVQPLKWVENHIIVQDPFLWQKNCAATMASKKGKAKFFKQLAFAHQLLSSRLDATLEDLVFNPELPVPRSPSVTSRGGRGGRGRGEGRGRGRGTPSRGRRTPSPKPPIFGLGSRLGGISFQK